MSEDYYATLGVSHSASAEEIQQAYRQLVRKYHPDLNPDDASAKKKFQQVQMAFDVLNDAKKRELYNRYGSNFESVAEGPRAGGHPWAGGAGGRAPGFGGAGSGFGGPGAGGHGFEINLEDLFGPGAGTSGAGGSGGFADLFKHFGGRGGSNRRRTASKRGSNLQHELTVPFTTAVTGGEAQISVHRADDRAETLKVKIPAGIDDGKKIRLRGQGEPAPEGGPAGDILIKVRVAPHPFFKRKGKRLDVRVPVTLFEAIHGAKIDVPTPQGMIALSIPPGTSSGTKLRVKGHGVVPKQGTPGDLFAEIQIALPKQIDDADREQLEVIANKYSNNPRTTIRW
jgi:DnaJ-class molecular chaperone